jgi:hypothetical protein
MLGMSKANGADPRPGRSSFRPRHWAQALAENPLARFVPFSSLISPHDVITRGGDYLRVWRLDSVAFECADEHQIGVVGVDTQRGVVERAGDQPVFGIDVGPAGTAIFRPVKPMARLGFDKGIQPVRRRGAYADIGAAEKAGGQPAAELCPGVAAVGGLVQPAIHAARCDRPGPALAMPHRRIKHLGVARLKFEIGSAQRIVDEQDFLPGLAAVARAIHAAIGRILEGIARCRNKDLVGIGRVDADRRDLADIAQTDESPSLGAIDRFVDTAADRDIAADLL